MRVLFTCGGTAGHVNPAVALAQMFQTRNSGCEVLFVGADGGMETRLVPKEGYPIETVTITNFRRSLSPASIGHNVRTLLNMNKSRKQANAILDRFQPDLVVGTGGYASFPVVKAAAKRGIPTAVHESNAVPGLTTKTLSKVVDVVMVECIALECRDGAPFHHIHGAGRDYRAVLDALQGSGLADHPEVDVREYIYDMPLVMAAADLVLCRAGASTIAEIAAIAKPAVLVPSPNVVADHQTKNARVLANAGGAVLLPEGESSGEKLYALMTGLLSDAPRREAMSRALRDMAVPDAAEQIYQTLVRLMEKRAN